MSEINKLQKKLKQCEENLKKAYDELWRIKKAPNVRKRTNLKASDLNAINKSIKRVHQIEDKIKANRKFNEDKKVFEFKKGAKQDMKNFDNPFTLPPIKGGKRKKRKYNKKK